MSRSSKKTRVPCTPGLFGITFNALGSVEANSKDALHTHMCVAAGLPAPVMAVACAEPTLHRAVEAFLDSTVAASQPAELHVHDLLRRLAGLEGFHGAWAAPLVTGPAIANGGRGLIHEVEAQGRASAARVQHHSTHYSRCHKGFGGRVKCDMAKPSAIQPQGADWHPWHVDGTENPPITALEQHQTYG